MANLSLYMQDIRIYDVGLSYNELMSLNNLGYGTFNGLYKNQTLRDPHHWYKLIDNQNNFFSDSGFLSMTLNSYTSSSGNIHQTKNNRVCTYFDGNYGYNLMPSIQTLINNTYFNFCSGFTISLWVYEDTLADSVQYWITNISGSTDTVFSLGQDINGYINGYISGYMVTGTTSWKQEWTHVVFIFDNYNEKLLLYVNSVNEDTTSSVKGDFTFDTGIFIGSDGDENYSCDDTYLKDIRLYNYALSEDEIYILYNTGLGLE